MRRLWTLLAIAGLGTAAYAQPPGGERPRPGPGGRDGPPNRERPREEPRRDQPRGEPRGGSHVEQWTRMLAEHMIDPHDSVRDSARAGLVAMGEKALPMLRNLANGPDDARATAAKKVIEAIERGNRRPGSGSPDRVRTSGGFGGPMGRGGQPFAAGGSAPFGRGPMSGGIGGGPMGPMGFGRGGPGFRPEGGERRPEARPMERRPEGGERREGERRPEGGERRPEARPMERRPEGGERREGERRPEGGERRPEAPQPTERRPG
jgi:hypothetical protein